MNPIQQITEIADTIRQSLLEMLKDNLGQNNTTGACLYACYLIKSAFDQFTDFQTFYRGGDGDADGAYIDSEGKPHGHYWLEVSTPSERYIVDITADQFNDQPIVVLPVDDAYQYIAGDQKIIDEHFRKLTEEIKKSP